MACRIPIRFATLQGQFSGTPVTTYPRMRRVSSISFPIPYALVGMHLSASMYNGTATAPVAVALVLGNLDPVITLSESIQTVGSFVQNTEINLEFMPTVYDQWFTWHKTGIELTPNIPLSLYFSASSVLSQDMTCVAALQLARIL